MNRVFCVSFSADTEFSLSLNGSELLSDTDQTLSSCGIVSGDLICVVLPESVATAAASNSSNATTISDHMRPSSSTTGRSDQQQRQLVAAVTSNQVSDRAAHIIVTDQSVSFRVTVQMKVKFVRDRDSNVSLHTFLCVKQPSSSSSAALTESEETTQKLDSEPSLPKWEPMLCSEAEEGQAPLSLEILYHTAQTGSSSDAVIVAGNLLMLETGFVPQVRLQT